jgi:hypothetical protein
MRERSRDGWELIKRKTNKQGWSCGLHAHIQGFTERQDRINASLPSQVFWVMWPQLLSRVACKCVCVVLRAFTYCVSVCMCVCVFMWVCLFVCVFVCGMRMCVCGEPGPVFRARLQFCSSCCEMTGGDMGRKGERAGRSQLPALSNDLCIMKDGENIS